MTRQGWIRILLAAVLGAAPGCAGDGPLGPAPIRPPPRIADDVFVIGAGTEGIGLRDIAADRLTLDWTGGPVPAEGDVIVGEERGGFIRRARTVERSGDRITVSTTPACLTDAVVAGYIDTTIFGGFAALTGASGTAVPAADGLRLDGIALIGGGADGASVTIERGRIEFDPRVSVSLSIYGGRMLSLEASVSGPLVLDIDLSAAFEAGASRSALTPIAEVRRTLTATIGPVPVPIVVTTRVLARTDLAARSSGACSWRYTSAHRLDAGVRLAGSWRGSPAVTGTPSESPAIERTDGADCRVEVALVCETEAAFFGAEPAPGRLRLEAALSALLDVAEEEWPWWSWTLDGVTAPSIGVRAGALSRAIPDSAVFCESDTVPVGSGPFRTASYIFVDEWDGGADRLEMPRALAIGPGGRLYVSDQGGHRIIVLGPDGSALGSWGGYGSTPGSFAFPAGVAVDRDGTVWVCDSGNHRIQAFTAGGTFLLARGTEGTGTGQFLQPEGIAANGDTLIAVCDGGSGAVVLLGASGAELARWSDGLARGAAFEAASALYVAACPASEVVKYSVSGAVLDRWESDGNGEPRFDCPLDIAVDPSGTVLVLEYGACRFTALSPDGETLSMLGRPGAAPGQFDRPGGIAVSTDGWVYVADTFNGRVQVFAPRPPESPGARARR